MKPEVQEKFNAKLRAKRLTIPKDILEAQEKRILESGDILPPSRVLIPGTAIHTEALRRETLMRDIEKQEQD